MKRKNGVCSLHLESVQLFYTAWTAKNCSEWKMHIIFRAEAVNCFICAIDQPPFICYDKVIESPDGGIGRRARFRS